MRLSTICCRRLAAASLLVFLAACGSLGDMLSPGKPGDAQPARLALNAVVPRFQQSNFSRLELRVVTTYLRQDQTEQPLGTQTLLLTDSATQTVQVSLELGPCLTDPARSDAATNPGACVVRLTVTLLGDGRALDNVQLLGLRLSPGVTTAVPQTVQLFEVALVQITETGATDPLPQQGLSVEAGTTVSLAARAFDATQQPVTGREIAWSSSNAAVATVSAAGLVTAVAAGQVTITAAVGGRTQSVTFTVTPPVRRLSVVAVPGTGAGRIVSSPAGIDCAISPGAAQGSCAFDFQNGATVTLTATFNPLSVRFAGWTGACLSNGQSGSCVLVMDQPRTSGASFTSLTPVSVQSSGSGVTITSSPIAGIACTLGQPPSGACTFGFVSGQTIVLSALEFSLARVDGWTGCDVVTRTTCTLSLAGVARTVSVAVVSPRVLIGAPTGSGNGIVTSPAVGSAGGALGLSCGNPLSQSDGRCQASYPFPSVVTVTATPFSGSRFVRWLGGGCDNESSPSCVVNLTDRNVQQRQLSAEFELVAPLTIDLSGIGGGNVFVNGAPACALGFAQASTQCVLVFAVGANVLLTGAPLLTGQFLGFGGACPAGSMTCTLTLKGPTTVTGSFAAAAPMVAPLTINLSGTGGGNVFVNGAPACALGFAQASRQCVLEFAVGANVLLTGAPLLTGQFLGFGQACPAGSMTCSLTLNGPTTVTGAFAATSPTVIVSMAVSGAGIGAGYVTSANQEIACDIVGSSLLGPRCSTTFNVGSTVTLTAYDDIAVVTSGLNVFRRWGANSPCPLSPEPECTFTISQNGVVEVEFVPAVSIAAALFGSAGGQLLVSVPGFRSIPGCAFTSNQSFAECEFFVPVNSSVTLTAVPESGAVADFSSISFCSFSGNSCTFQAQSNVSGGIAFLPQEDD